MLPSGVTYADLVTANPSLPKTVHFEKSGVPTIFGPSEAESTSIGELFSELNTTNPALYAVLIAALGPNARDKIPLPFIGLDVPDMMPSPALQVTALTLGIKKIPVIDNVQLGIRYMPSIDAGDFSLSWWGIKLQHEFTRFVPVVKNLPFLHTSAYWAMNSISMDLGPASIDQGNWVAMVNASADVKFLIGLGAFIGLGYESSSLDMSVDMSKADLPSYSLSIDGSNGFRFQPGVRISLLNFDIYGAMNLGSVTTYEAGITLIGLNGL
jgi:hypothetical protein